MATKIHMKPWLCLVLMIPLLLAISGYSYPGQRAAQQPGGGYWEYVETVTDQSESSFAETRIATFGDNSISLLFKNPPASGDDTEYRALCSWQMQFENGSARLYPGQKIKADLTVSNQSGDQVAHGYINTDMAYTSPSGDAGRGIVGLIQVGPGQSLSNPGEYEVETGPIDGYGDMLALEVTCAYGFSANSQMIYRWVAAEAVPPESGNVQQQCLATITLPEDMEPGREFYPSVSVVGSVDGQSITPQDGYWLYNSVQADTMQWDGEAATVDYVYTCPADGTVQTVSASIPARSPSGGISWVVVAGGIAVVAATAATVAAAARSTLRKDRRSKSQAQKKTYILQLSTNKVDISEGQSHPLQVKAWLVTTGGGYQPAPEAAITLNLSDPNCGLAVTPKTGQGVLACTISLPKLLVSKKVTLSAVASAGGVQTQGAVEINILSAVVFGAWVGGKNQTDVTYQAHLEPPRWDFGEVIAYFHAPDHESQPVQPAFQHNLSAPVFTPVPDILQVTNWGEHAPGQFSGDVSLRPGVDLEQYLGPDLSNQGGLIPLTITVTAQDGHKYQQTVQFLICPTLQLNVRGYDGVNPAHPGGHTYADKGLTWQEFEFAADGQDRLHLAAFFTRADKQVPPGQEPLAVANLGSIKTAGWDDADDRSEFLLPTLKPSTHPRGFFTLETGSKTLLQATRPRLTRPHTLVIEGGLRPGVPGRYRLANPTVKVTVKPQFLDVRLWVAPGFYRGTSEAYAYAKLFPCRQPYPGQALRLQVDSLTIKDSPDQITCVTDQQPSPTVQLVKGTAGWVVQYSGMTWENLAQAVFQVHCQVLDAHNKLAFTVTETVNVHQNVLDTLSALVDDGELGKELNNPAFLTDTYTPLFARGPLWNILQLFDSSAPFVCYRMRNKIIQWLENRRIYADGNPHQEMARMRTMNGIEFDYYSMNPAHVWAGIFLSGMDRYADYRAIDPWWEQSWTSSAYRKPEGLMTHWDEKGQVAKCAASAIIAAGALVSLAPAFKVATGAVGITMINEAAALEAITAWVSGHKIVSILTALGATGAAVAADYAIFTSLSDYAGPDGLLQNVKFIWLRNFIAQINTMDAEIPAHL